MSLTGRVFFLSPRPLLKKEKTRDRMLSYLTLYLGIVPCLQGLSRFSKHIGRVGKNFSEHTAGKKQFCNVTGIPESLVLDTLELPIP